MDFLAEIQVSELGLKSRSKKEMYDLLCVEGEIYLPLIADAHHKYISQILTGEKKYLKSTQIKVCSVPHLAGLQIADLLKFGRLNGVIDDYLPEYEYKKLPNREWLWNVLNTLLGESFKSFVQTKIKERTKHVVTMKKLNVKALPEFIDIFKKSQSVSVQNGRTHYLIKSTRKRKFGQIKDDNRDKLKDQERKIQQLNASIDELSKKIDWYQSQEEENFKNKESLVKLYQMDIIDSDGEYKE